MVTSVTYLELDEIFVTTRRKVSIIIIIIARAGYAVKVRVSIDARYINVNSYFLGGITVGFDARNYNKTSGSEMNVRLTGFRIRK